MKIEYQSLTPSEEDLNWFNTFLPKFNGTAKYVHTDLDEAETLAMDACLQGVREFGKIISMRLPSHKG